MIRWNGRIMVMDVRFKAWRDLEYYSDSSWHGTWEIDGGLLAFDLGEEMQSGQSVSEELTRRLKVTVPLSLIAVFLTSLPVWYFSF